jgi:hypothetical protein
MTHYRERLSPSWWITLSVALLIPATSLIFLPVNLPLGIAVGISLWAGSMAVLWFSSPTVSVTDSHLSAGSATIDHKFVSGVEVFRKDQATMQRGTKLDARAWLVIRGWVDPVVKVTLNDPKDPTPYWLVSAREPDKLAAALAKRTETT